MSILVHVEKFQDSDPLIINRFIDISCKFKEILYIYFPLNHL